MELVQPSPTAPFTITAPTIRQNGGGAIYNYLATTVIANSILWGNTAAVGPQVYSYLFPPNTTITPLQHRSARI